MRAGNPRLSEVRERGADDHHPLRRRLARRVRRARLRCAGRPARGEPSNLEGVDVCNVRRRRRPGRACRGSLRAAGLAGPVSRLRSDPRNGANRLDVALHCHPIRHHPRSRVYVRAVRSGRQQALNSNGAIFIPPQADDGLRVRITPRHRPDSRVCWRRSARHSRRHYFADSARVAQASHAARSCG